MADVFPFNITDVDSIINDQLKEDFPGIGLKDGFVQVGRYIMPDQYRGVAQKMYNFKPRPDDTWVSTFPRSGTTLMQEMVWLISNNLDYETASKISLNNRFPFIDLNMLIPADFREIVEEMANESNQEELKEEHSSIRGFAKSMISSLEADKSPRFIKTHMPFCLLSPDLIATAKVVYVARNPKDVAVSYYYHNRLFQSMNFSKDFSRYWDLFQRDLVSPCSYWENIREAWELRNHPNMLFLFYEDIVTNWPACISKVSHFLGKQLSDDQITKLADHMQIDNFRKNPAVNMELDHVPGTTNTQEQSFIRKGVIDGWKAEFTPELCEQADKWIAENIAAIPGFAFPPKKN